MRARAAPVRQGSASLNLVSCLRGVREAVGEGGDVLGGLGVRARPLARRSVGRWGRRGGLSGEREYAMLARPSVQAGTQGRIHLLQEGDARDPPKERPRTPSDRPEGKAGAQGQPKTQTGT
jgi:hypothetical protein